jgi:hypothetical protein
MGWCWYIHNETRDLYYYLGGDTDRIQYAFHFIFNIVKWSFNDTLSIISDEGRVIDFSKVVNF